MKSLKKMRFLSILLTLLLVAMMAAPTMVMAAALSSDATLKASSTVKGETLLSLGMSSASGDIYSNGGTVTITAAEAANTTNLTSYITLFDPTDARATVKVVKFSQWSTNGYFDSLPAYANQAITNQDYFWVKVTAPDTTTLYYKVNVTVTPAPVSAITVTGNTVVGATLTAAPTPSGATGTYQWKSSGSADGTYANITGATSSTYVIDNAYAGKFIKVTFTATGSYSGTQTSVATGTIDVQGTVDITKGCTVLGDTLQIKIPWFTLYKSSKNDIQLGISTAVGTGVTAVWTSDNPGKVQVDQTGKVKNLDFFARSANITVKLLDSEDNVLATDTVKIVFYRFDYEAVIRKILSLFNQL